MPATIDFKGSAEECLNHFLHEFSWPEVQAFTAEFTGVTTNTVRVWYNTGHEPQGMGKIRARVMLHMLGYKVKEYDSLPSFNKRLAQLLVFDVLTVEAVLEITGHTHDSAVMRLVRDGKKMEKNRLFQVERELKDEKFSDRLDLKRSVAENRIEKFLRNLKPVAGRSNDEDQLEQDASPTAETPQVDIVQSPASSPASARVSVSSSVLVTSVVDDMAYALTDMVKAIASLSKVLESSPEWETQRHYVRIELGRHQATDVVMQFLERVR